MKLKTDNKGVTLIELLVSIAVSGVVLGGVYSSFYSQQKSFLTQEQTADMQQNLRSAMYLMAREIRMAGYDPTGDAGAGIHTAHANSIRITKDITDDSGTGVADGDAGDVNEDVTYALVDVDGDGDMDLGRTDTNGVGTQLLAENMDALNFVYLDDNGSPTANISEMRSVQITAVARADRPDPGYNGSGSFLNQQGQIIFTPPAGDRFRRKLLTEEVKSRNLGLL
jgi:type IV pilus assembly protein PilW